MGDFGWTVHDTSKKPRKTYCGTPAYLSPEICLRNSHDKSVDIWAYGIILFELRFNKHPFRSKDID